MDAAFIRLTSAETGRHMTCGQGPGGLSLTLEAARAIHCTGNTSGSLGEGARSRPSMGGSCFIRRLTLNTEVNALLRVVLSLFLRTHYPQLGEVRAHSFWITGDENKV